MPDRIKDQFHAALETVRRQVDFFSSAMKVRMRSANIFSIGEIGPEDRPVVDRFRAGAVGEGTATFEALYVSICFHFEEFIRDEHRNVLAEINRRYPRVEQISRQLLGHHIIATGEIMVRHLKDARASKIDVVTYARNAGSCAAGNPNYVLNTDAFTFFLQGASPEEMERVFGKIGFHIDWDAFGRNNELKTFFRGGGAREVGKQSRNFIEEFVSSRNRIVHRGGGYPQVSDTMIVSTINFFKPFSDALSGELERFCQGYRA